MSGQFRLISESVYNTLQRTYMDIHHVKVYVVFSPSGCCPVIGSHSLKSIFDINKALSILIGLSGVSHVSPVFLCFSYSILHYEVLQIMNAIKCALFVPTLKLGQTRSKEIRSLNAPQSKFIFKENILIAFTFAVARPL